MPEEIKVLSQSEIKDLNKDGSKLDDSGDTLYILKFLFNDKLNKAADPIPFRIVPDAVEKIAKTFIGRPYVNNPGIIKGNKGEHIRGPTDDPAKIIEFQKKFSIGIIDKTLIKPNNNVYGIIGVFPEFKDDVLSGKVPLPTSPLLEPLKWDGKNIFDARGIHLQAVKNSGYDMELTSQLGVCEGMLNKCTEELKTLGASRKLKNFQNTFLNTTRTIGSSLSSENVNTENKPTQTPEEMLNAHEQMLAAHGKTLGEHTQTLGAMSDKLDQVLKQTSGNPEDNYDAGKQNPDGAKKPGSVGAAAVQDIEMIKKELADIKALRKKELDENKAKDEKRLMKERESLAGIIVDFEIHSKEIPEDKADDRIKYYVNLKDEETKQPIDLKLLAAKASKIVKTIGSHGTSKTMEQLSEEFPSLENPTVGASGSKSKSTAEIMREIGV